MSEWLKEHAWKAIVATNVERYPAIPIHVNNKDLAQQFYRSVPFCISRYRSHFRRGLVTFVVTFF
jgi:hypothetical protein